MKLDERAFIMKDNDSIRSKTEENDLMSENSPLIKLVKRLAHDVTDYFRADNLVIAAVLAALVYNKLCASIVSILFFRSKDVEKRELDGTKQRYLLVSDPERDMLWIAIRGTGGEDLKSKFKAWLYNFMFWKRKNGEVTGFARLADNIMNDIMTNRAHLLSNHKYICVTGTSQGGACAIILGKRIAELYANTVKPAVLEDHEIAVFAFAAPPAGDEKLCSDIAAFYPHLHGSIVTLPGDPVCTDFAKDFLWDENSVFRDGVDPFEVIELPDINRLDKGLSKMNNHSPTQYLASLSVQIASTSMSDVQKTISSRLVTHALEATVN